MPYPPTLCASGQNSGTAGVVTATLTLPMSVGDFPVALFSAAASTGSFVSVADSSGGVNAWSVISLTAVTSEEMALAWPTTGALAATLGVGATITATLSAGTPGGRMFTVLDYGSLFVAATPIDQTATAAPPASASVSASTPGPAGPVDLAVAVCAMRSTLAGGTDAITIGAPFTQRDNRNHTGTTTAYMAVGDVLAANPVTALFSFLAADNAGVILATFTQAPPPPPGAAGAQYAWRPIMEATVQREGYAGID